MKKISERIIELISKNKRKCKHRLLIHHQGIDCFLQRGHKGYHKGYVEGTSYLWTRFSGELEQNEDGGIVIWK